jgi:hypothetical protein
MEAAVVPSKRDLLVNPFGRRFQSEIVTTKNANKVQREALSFLPQSTSSDIAIATAIRINGDLNDAGYHIFNMVHDAIMIEGPEDGADMVGEGRIMGGPELVIEKLVIEIPLEHLPELIRDGGLNPRLPSQTERHGNPYGPGKTAESKAEFYYKEAMNDLALARFYAERIENGVEEVG